MIKLLLAKLKTISWKQWLLVAFFFLMAIIIFGKCNKDKPVEKIIVPVPDKAVVKERDAYRDTVEYYRSQIATSKKEKESTDRLLINANKQLKGLISKYNEATRVQDVPQIILSCDSIVEQNTSLMEINGLYQSDMNQLIDYYDLALKASDSSSLYQTRLATTLNANLQTNIADYNELAKVYNKQVKKTKRNRGLNRVLAGALLVTSGILIVK